MIRVRNINVPIDNDNQELISKKICKKLKIDEKRIKTIKINKKSIDARKKKNVHFVYEAYVSLDNEIQVLKRNKSNDISSEIRIESLVTNKLFGSIKKELRLRLR